MSDAVASIFTRIIRGEIPCHLVFRNEHLIAFLDINPLAEGHTLVVPIRQVERLDQLSPEEAAALARELGPIAGRVTRCVGAEGYNILQNNGAAAGQVVPHVHFHIIPRRAGDGLGFIWKPRPTDHPALSALAARLRDG